MLQEILGHFGSRARLAKALGVSAPAVTVWYQIGRIPAKRALQIEDITGGKFRAVLIPTQRGDVDDD